MSRRLALTAMAATVSLCLALAGCGGDSASSSAASPEDAQATAPTTEVSSKAESSDQHNGNFVGTWNLYQTDEATHEQVAELMERYATDEEFRAQMNEAYGRDNVEFCARFNADGTGEIDTGVELSPFTWEATNEGAVTFTSFSNKETALHIPVSDDKFTLNGDTYAKAD